MSNSVCAPTVVVPPRPISASSWATRERSMSVAVRPSRPPASAASFTFERIGMVVRRSTTFWTWLRDRNSAARSIDSFMDRACSSFRSRTGTVRAAASWRDAQASKKAQRPSPPLRNGGSGTAVLGGTVRSPPLNEGQL
jgi:hypothetical protein